MKMPSLLVKSIVSHSMQTGQPMKFCKERITDKEEILRKSRNENQNKDIYELDVIRRGQRIGGMIAIGAAGLFIFKSLKLKRKHEIVFAVPECVLTVYASVRLISFYIR